MPLALSLAPMSERVASASSSARPASVDSELDERCKDRVEFVSNPKCLETITPDDFGEVIQLGNIANELESPDTCILRASTIGGLDPAQAFIACAARAAALEEAKKEQAHQQPQSPPPAVASNHARCREIEQRIAAFFQTQFLSSSNPAAEADATAMSEEYARLGCQPPT
jgi:hypothetical protein